MNKLNSYVGRIVRLNQQVFQKVIARDKKRGDTPENSFIVATVSRGMRKLVCYGSHLRIEVSMSEVVFV